MEEPLQLSADDIEQAEILQEFIEQSLLDIQEANEAKRNKKPDDLKRIVHRIKGASLMVGVAEITVICKEIELALKENRWKSVPSALTRLNEAIQQLERSVPKLPLPL